jgi:hypothetical protein
VEALAALSNLARLLGKSDARQQLAAEFENRKAALEEAFWSPEIGSYAFALGPDDRRVTETSVLSAVPMWFGLANSTHADETITKLSAEDHQADWGMRIISRQSKVYDGSGYHYGSVWPLFTGWASVAEYRYHRAFPAYSNLRANALLGFDGALGHFTEVLSGDYYDSFATSSPHQIWSAAMVVSPILRGMFGLESEAEKHQVTFAPHVPADWTWFAIRNVRAGEAILDFEYHKTADRVVLDIQRTGGSDAWVEFSPALSLRTQVTSVEMNGRPLPFKLQPNGNDQHLYARFPVDGRANTVVIRLKNDFGLTLTTDLPPLGSSSRQLRILSESWNPGRDQMSLAVSGLAGRRYELAVWNPEQVRSVEGAVLTKSGTLEIRMPETAANSYVPHQVILHFAH